MSSWRSTKDGKHFKSKGKPMGIVEMAEQYFGGSQPSSLRHSTHSTPHHNNSKADKEKSLEKVQDALVEYERRLTIVMKMSHYSEDDILETIQDLKHQLEGLTEYACKPITSDWNTESKNLRQLSSAMLDSTKGAKGIVRMNTGDDFLIEAMTKLVQAAKKTAVAAEHNMHCLDGDCSN